MLVSATTSSRFINSAGTATTNPVTIVAKLGVRYFFDWGGGLVWLAVVDADDAGASVVREAMANTGGHATLVRASSEMRHRIDVFEPLPPAVLKLTQEIKKCFDPDRVLNFGRMYAGI